MFPTHEVAEVARDHELERLRGAGGVASDHRVAGHDARDGSEARVETLGGDAEGKVLCGEDTAETLLLVDDKDTVGALGSAELGGVGDAHALGDG
jgi:hypothetical protein